MWFNIRELEKKKRKFSAHKIAHYKPQSLNKDVTEIEGITSHSLL